jgi:hypothetical protein
MVHLAGIDQVFAFAAAEIDTVPIIAVQREAGDRQRFALGAGLLDPVVASAGGVGAVTHLRDNSLQPDFAGVGVHLAAVDIEALAELDVGAVNDLLEVGLAFDQRQPPEIATIEVKEIECDEHDLLRKTENSVVPFSAGTTTSPSMIAEPALMCQASSAIFRKRVVQSLPRRVNTLTASLARWTWTR